jgi:hypothetical protein
LCGTVYVDGAGAALSDSAPELGTRHAKFVTNNPEQRRISLAIEGDGLRIDLE